MWLSSITSGLMILESFFCFIGLFYVNVSHSLHGRMGDNSICFGVRTISQMTSGLFID